MQEYLPKQDKDHPLFPDLLWSRPENRQTAGKLLIIGGHAYTFAAPATAYMEAVAAGIGTAHVILPDSLRKITGHILEEVEFALSTPSGSFSSKSLDQLLDEASWADAVLMAGDFGRNSETAILLEKFIEKFAGQITITADAADYFLKIPTILDNSQLTLVVSMGQLQKLAIHSGFIRPFTLGMGVVQLFEALQQFSSIHKTAIVVKHLTHILVAVDGQVSVTTLTEDAKVWRVRTSAHAAVWRLQNPTKPFEALTTALLE